MTLLELLVQQLPKLGGWPAGASTCERFLDESNISFYDEQGNWPEDCGIKYGFSFAEKLVQPKPNGKGPHTQVVKKEEYEAALAASKQPEWDGEGLPPVGTHCEYNSESNGWVVCEILLYRKTVVIIESDIEGEGITMTHTKHAEFRPIRTESERKREEVGLALYHAINWNDEGELVGPSRMEDYRKAYDAIAAGKIPGIKLAD